MTDCRTLAVRQESGNIPERRRPTFAGAVRVSLDENTVPARRVSLSHEDQEGNMTDDESIPFCSLNVRVSRLVSSFGRPMRGALFGGGSQPLRHLAAAAVLALAGASATSAAAHGRLGAAEGRCRLFIGPDIMHFTGYLPEASKNEFCEDIPSTGPMIMVLDAEQDELRDMKVELRIVKDVGGEDKENENLEAVTVAYREPKSYPTGTINFEHTFTEPGYFVGIVTVTGDHGERWVSRFPFSVDKTFMRDLPVYLTLGLGVLAAAGIYLVHRRRNPPPQIAAAAAAFKTPPAPPGAGEGDAAPRQNDGEREASPDREADAAAGKDDSAGKRQDDSDDREKYRTAAE